MQKPSNVVTFEDLHAYIICTQMRPDEITQLLAFTGADSYDHEMAARAFINKPGPKFTLVDEQGQPVIVGGYSPVIDGVWQSWMAGTEAGWCKHWRAITKASRWLMDALFEAGARRLQTNALQSRREAIMWYERGLHLKYEGTWKEFGCGGEDVACYAISRSAYYGHEQQ
jgi:hypothetical protein